MVDPGTILEIVKIAGEIIKGSKAIQTGIGVCAASIGGGIAAEKIIDATIRAKEADNRNKIMAEHPELIPDAYWIAAAANNNPKNPKKGIWGNGPKQSHADQYF